LGKTDVRHPAPGDAETFGALLLNAYHGTVDYEGEDLAASIVSAGEFLDGIYFPPIWEASFAAMKDGRMSSISFVADFEGIPLLVITATEKTAKRTGLASQLIEHSLDALHRHGRPALRLWVTCANTPAVAAYEKLGFVPEQT
jgi:GNAT superfamily N-acetyltransferase